MATQGGMVLFAIFFPKPLFLKTNEHLDFNKYDLHRCREPTPIHDCQQAETSLCLREEEEQAQINGKTGPYLHQILEWFGQCH